MQSPQSSHLTTTEPTPNFLATSLTNDAYVSVSRIWAGDDTQSEPIMAGTVVAHYTSGPNAGKVAAYDPAETDGREIATGILTHTIGENQLYREDSGVLTAVDIIVSVFTGGEFIAANLTGLDAGAEADLNATTDNAGILRI